MNNKIAVGIAMMSLALLAVVPPAAADNPNKPVDCAVHGPPRGTVVGEALYVAGTAVEGACIIADMTGEVGKAAVVSTALFVKETSEDMAEVVQDAVDAMADHARTQANRVCEVLVGQPCV